MGAAVPFGVPPPPPPPPKKPQSGALRPILPPWWRLWRDPAAWCRLPSFNGELDRQFEVYAAAVRRACVDEYRERLRRDRTGDMWPAEGPLPVRRSRVGLDRRRARLAGGAARRGRRPGRAEAIGLLFERLRGPGARSRSAAGKTGFEDCLYSVFRGGVVLVYNSPSFAMKNTETV